ncbi:hypothetical protein KZZ52_34950 [Dactylosporangium sp. AC04546]|uniref:hypothetical protein n=1 Tax=Dactylosporangium sp. AC04546 TaxID=2862460 RepID=UPI001EE15381|nr:hypothetical protein [Dactylosporangium sp. AC04546]WVK79169.1 hypothetical protein KZZ52_34950 [Dactylosporangium sp. AC04546]
MSSIASLYFIDRRLVRRLNRRPLRELLGDRDEMRVAARVLDLLDAYAREVEPEYDWSGYCMQSVLTHLEEQGARFGTLRRRCGLTYLVETLPRHIDLTGYEDLFGQDPEEALMAAEDTVALLRTATAARRAGELLLIMVG